MEKLSEFLREAWEMQRPNLSSAVAIVCGDENRPVDAFIAEIEELEAKADCNDFENWCAAVRGDVDAPEPMKQIIEKYCLRLPVDENGKPWKIGDKARADRDTGTVIGISDGCGIYVRFDNLSESDGWYPTSMFTRPLATVLAADGLSIEVGQRIWTSMYDQWFTVERISNNSKGEPLVMVCEMGSGLFPSTCTHTPPDSWEKLEDDFISAIIFCPRMNESDSEQAESILSRIRALREKEQA